jgi:hypothetical protein
LICSFSKYNPLQRLVILIASLSPLFTIGQNLIMNPYLRDVNICCENQQPCRPEGVFSIPIEGEGVTLNRDNKQYIRINPVRHQYDLPPAYCMFALFSGIDTTAIYEMEIHTPGNGQLKMMYSFTDSTLIYSTQDKDSLLRSIHFDTTTVKGKKNKLQVRPKDTGNYMIVLFQNTDKDVRTTYGQLLSFIGLKPANTGYYSVESFNERKSDIYGENRAHNYKVPCPENTLKRSGGMLK